MNQLSWLLYLANVCGNLGIILGIGFFGGLFLYSILGCIAMMADYEDTKDKVRKTMKDFVWPFVVIILLCAVVPSSKTLYAIAASQVGDQVLHSQVGTKAEQALEAWMDSQIAKAKS